MNVCILNRTIIYRFNIYVADSQKLYIREIYGDPIALEVYSLGPGQEFNVTISIQGVSSINEASVTTSFTTPGK